MEYLDKLASFVAGKTSADEMTEALYERLSELREREKGAVCPRTPSPGPRRYWGNRVTFTPSVL